MASIVERNGMFQAKVRRKGHPPQSRSFARKSDAASWARQVESQMDRGVWRDQSGGDMPLTELLGKYLEAVVPTKRGAAVEQGRIETLQRDKLSHYSLLALTPPRLAEWRDARLAGGAAGSTVNRELNLISGVINWGRKELHLPVENPVAAIRRPKNPPARERRLEAGEEEKLLSALGDHEAHREDGKKYRVGTRNTFILPAVRLAIETGMRRSEMLSLVWEDVDLKRQVARVRGIEGRATKNGEQYRDVPLSKAAVSILSEMPRVSSGQVFPITLNAFKLAIKRGIDRAGLIDFRFHDLRHEGTSRLAEKLDNVLELAAVTGHKDLRMLKRYYHPRAEDLAKKLG